MMRVQTRPAVVIYWSIACVLLGVIFAPFFGGSVEDHSTHLTHDHKMAHLKVEVNPQLIPEVSLAVVKDSMAGWNLSLITKNFKFTPENVNASNQPNEGHAHIYVNGKKVTRLYSNHYHLSAFPAGKHTVTVSLNANDHSQYALKGAVISASTQVEQP